jgi:C-terminal processing protease CtpA/Prc
LPFTSELPNGWGIRFSAAPITGPDGQLTEFGVEPDVRVDMSDEDISNGKDTILEKAFEVLKNKQNK